MSLKIYALAHVLLALGMLGSALLRRHRKEPLIYFANDTLYLLLGFLALAGGVLLVKHVLPGA